MAKNFLYNAVVMTTDGGCVVNCQGETPVSGSFSGGEKTTWFSLTIEKDILTFEVGRGSRTPFYGDVLDAILEVTSGYDSESNPVVDETNGVGMEYKTMVYHGKKYSMGVDWNDKLSFRGQQTVPCSVARALSLALRDTWWNAE